MPKIVNHDDRRKQLAEAAWRIIRREGLEAVSVRNVAKEAGMSLGSLRHYFASQADLLVFSMKLVSERSYSRTLSFEETGDPRKDVELLISELMPLDEERRAEGEVWLAFVGNAVIDPEMQALKYEVHNRLHEAFRGMLEYLAAHHLLKEGLDLAVESKRLHALVDGLVVHNIIYPELMTPEEMVQQVTVHLDSLKK
ncbi:HTH-type transcriptional regulator PksA [Paenibacillus albidus]|uniref:HTH-type transcriptional regulator PksA n=1 Tax=Paenibacillus albidus TaxID=2041023 RepID=A0A917FHV7_9BACL|nr:HTH-type transcriptional regulator PksA [Paenibacillus albidus]